MKQLFSKRNVVIFSIILPLAVAALYFIPRTGLGRFAWVHSLPLVNAIINGSTTVCLLIGLWFIKQKNINAHKKTMMIAVLLSVLFLLSYVLYHSSVESTKYGGEGILATLYYILLITHILLAIIIVPFVLLTLSRAVNDEYIKHKKIARVTFPLWLYVTISGVLVYVLLAPYY